MTILLISIWMACGVVSIKIIKDVMPKYNFNRPTRWEAIVFFIGGCIGLIAILFVWMAHSDWSRKRL